MYKEMIRTEIRRSYDPGSIGRQIAATAISGDRRPLLATIKVPSLVIRGDEDKMFVPLCGEDTAKSIPNAKYILLKGMGHDLPMELEEQFSVYK